MLVLVSGEATAAAVSLATCRGRAVNEWSRKRHAGQRRGRERCKDVCRERERDPKRERYRERRKARV